MNKQIVISSDRPPKEMEKLEERMRCRFEWGLIADIKMPDYETRVAILLKKVQALRSVNPSALPIRDDALHYIAQQKNSNIRTPEGALQKVIMYAELHKESLPSGRSTLPSRRRLWKISLLPLCTGHHAKGRSRRGMRIFRYP